MKFLLIRLNFVIVSMIKNHRINDICLTMEENSVNYVKNSYDLTNKWQIAIFNLFPENGIKK